MKGAFSLNNPLVGTARPPEPIFWETVALYDCLAHRLEPAEEIYCRGLSQEKLHFWRVFHSLSPSPPHGQPPPTRKFIFIVVLPSLNFFSWGLRRPVFQVRIGRLPRILSHPKSQIFYVPTSSHNVLHKRGVCRESANRALVIVL